MLLNVRTMDEVFEAVQSRPRFLMMLLTIFSSVALLLAAVGIYGVISYAVEQRTNEFGHPHRFGRGPGSVGGMVLRQVLILGAAGIVCGALGVSSFDPATFAVMAVALLG